MNETHSNAKVKVIRTGGTTGDISAEFTIQSDTAVLDSDFLMPEKTILKFDDGEIEKVVEIPLVEDELFEGNESFTIHLSSIEDSDIESPSTSTVVILDDDPDTSIASIHMEAVNYSVRENKGSVTLRVMRSGNSDATVSVEYTTVNGSAKAGEDYRAESGKLTFWPKVTRREITLEIYDDGEYEKESSFTLVLSEADGDSHIAKPSAAIIRIGNDDALPNVSLSTGSHNTSAGSAQSNAIGGLGNVGTKSKSSDAEGKSGNGSSGLKIFDISLRGYSGLDDDTLRGIQTLGGNLDESIIEAGTGSDEEDSEMSDCSAEDSPAEGCNAEETEDKEKTSSDADIPGVTETSPEET